MHPVSVGRECLAPLLVVDKVLEHMATEYPLHEALANEILEQGMASGFDLALSWDAPVDHAFLSPVNTMLGPATHPAPRADLRERVHRAAPDGAAVLAGDMRKINELGGCLHLVMSVPRIGPQGGH